MRAVLWLVVLVAVPGLWFVAQGEALRWFSEGEPPRLLRPAVDRLRPHTERLERAWRRLCRRPDPQPLPPVLITLELRRLAQEVRRVEEGDAPHRAARLRAVLAAYDHVLLELCERIELPTDVGMPPLPPGDRITLEAELVAAGHEW